MKLKVMSCKNCNAPLHLEDGKLVCAFCGASFYIEKDASDIEYEKTVNAETYIRQALAKETNELNEYYKITEAGKIAQEKVREEEEIIKRRENLKKSLFFGIKTFIVITLISAGIISLVQFSLKNDEKRAAREKENRIAKAEQSVTTRVTKTELENSPKALKKIESLVYDFESSEYEEKEKEVDDEIWVMSQEPEIVSTYLLTTEEDNTVYSFVKTVFKTSDGREKEVYNCVAIDGLTVDTKGKVTLDPKEHVYSPEASDYEYYWRGGFDKDLLYEEVIMERRQHPEKPLLFYYEL
ncbi:MAG: hypothetical protein IKG30_11605 [Clostridiales bacterium]|nr:hypothetical protein [Clostridiales bacterium]